jgi:hypothetical protein
MYAGFIGKEREPCDGDDALVSRCGGDVVYWWITAISLRFESRSEVKSRSWFSLGFLAIVLGKDSSHPLGVRPRYGSCHFEPSERSFGKGIITQTLLLGFSFLWIGRQVITKAKP